jgi:hypothetical protein
MSPFLKSIFHRRCAGVGSRVGRGIANMRTLRAWTILALAKLKDFAPYAAMELILPGGSVLALSLWLYRRRRKRPALAASLNALL